MIFDSFSSNKKWKLNPMERVLTAMLGRYSGPLVFLFWQLPFRVEHSWPSVRNQAAVGVALLESAQPLCATSYSSREGAFRGERVRCLLHSFVKDEPT